MKAVVYKENGIIGMEERPIPKLLDERDAIIRVTMTTICSSDIHIKHGAVPRAVPGVILGHEFVGEVMETGAKVTTVKPGDRVAVNVETFCGECFYCKKGYVNNCTDPHGGWALGCRIDGGQAEFVRIPFADHGLTKIPDTVSDEEALFTGDLLSTGYWVAKIGEIKKGDTVLVLGAGPTGMCAMMAAKLYEPGAVIAADLMENRLELVRTYGLADRCVSVEKDQLLEIVGGMTDGRGADVVIEAAGGQDTFQLAWQAARPNGIVCVVAMYEEDQRLPLPQMYGKNLTFKTGGVDAADCPVIMELIREKKLDATCLITHRTDFSNMMEAYRVFEEKEDGIIKWAIKV
ncbi:MAG: alcohol dehydrogenase catalytic domain-containing protein [Clostridiales bacterium]|nr:alcohol dehydrogenase catalytic domain-containing protein [Clostridiales bacterium]